jgi:hypothetical protein
MVLKTSAGSREDRPSVWVGAGEGVQPRKRILTKKMKKAFIDLGITSLLLFS